MIVVSGILTDIVPSFPMTQDILLISIFGGLILSLIHIWTGSEYVSGAACHATVPEGGAC